MIIRESGRTPEPIIVEKIVQRKKPQLIIKEIHVNEPAPPPIKVVEEIVTDSNSDFDAKKVYKKLLQQSPHHRTHQSRPHRGDYYKDPFNLSNYSTYPDNYSKHRSKSKNTKYYNNHDIYNNRKSYHNSIIGGDPNYQPYYNYQTGENYLNDRYRTYNYQYQYQKPNYIPVPVYTQTYHPHQTLPGQGLLKFYYHYFNSVLRVFLCTLYN